MEDLGLDGGIILKWILKEQVNRAWSRLIWFGLGKSGGGLL